MVTRLQDALLFQIPGCGDLNVERDHSSGGDGNLAHFTGVHVQEADAACTRTIHKTNILLGSEENAVGVHTAKGFAGLQQPPLDSAQKEPCLDRSSSLSDISTTTIGEMNDRADYVKMAKRLKEAMCMQESHISGIMETLTFYGKNKVRKFAKIYTERELLLCRERYSVLHRELQRVEALLSKYKRIPQLSQSVQSTCEVSSITVQLCRNFRTGSIGESESLEWFLKLSVSRHKVITAEESCFGVTFRRQTVNVLDATKRSRVIGPQVHMICLLFRFQC
ncbi:hypothetical protein Tcan_09507 [Toxocara canis]|uniref:Uncharacterized protein n=1 Tax=Toxocara canis TaxID=6265 RepID=A0A0B2VI16_TOXCA|nr:hypothetical protein Tcan_09507 [Toxocara canis]